MRYSSLSLPMVIAALAVTQTAAQSPDAAKKAPEDAAAPAATNKPEQKSEPPKLKPAAVSAIDPEDLADFDSYAPQVQQLIRRALALTKLNLTYTFGSSDPGLGGMDCSGTISHLLQGLGLKGVPRQSDQMAQWVANQTLLHRPDRAKAVTDPAFAALNPGDLLFWTGTYDTGPRETGVSHVMLYLGKLKKGGRPVLFGASDGRVYQGQRRTGVSVFDFTLPKAQSASAFYGYGLIPSLGSIKVDPPEPPAPSSTIAISSAAPAGKETVPEKAKSTAPKEEVRKAATAEAPSPQAKSSKAKAPSKKK